jgi:hypothetical protein
MSVRANVIASTVALMVVTGFAGLAAAQQSQDATACINEGNSSPDTQIGGYTAAMQSDRWQGKAMAFAFSNRGNAFVDKKEHDRAVTYEV